VTVPDLVLEMRRILEPLHRVGVADAPAPGDSSSGRPTKGRARRGSDSVPSSPAPEPGPRLVASLEQDAPSGHFDLFQKHAPTTFSSATGRPEWWAPPSLVGSPDFMSWTGPLDRTETVKLLRHVVNVKGCALTLPEIEYAVHLLDSAEASARSEQWDAAYRCCIDLLRRYPNLSLAYFKAGLLMITAQGIPQPKRSARSTSSVNRSFTSVQPANTSTSIDAQYEFGSTATGASDADSQMNNHSDTRSQQMGTRHVAVAPLVLNHACNFFRCAVAAEPANRHLAGLIDFVVRLSLGMPVSRSHKYRDPALYPRSLGDAVCLAYLEKPENFAV